MSKIVIYLTDERQFVGYNGDKNKTFFTADIHNAKHFSSIGWARAFLSEHLFLADATFLSVIS